MGRPTATIEDMEMALQMTHPLSDLQKLSELSCSEINWLMRRKACELSCSKVHQHARATERYSGSGLLGLHWAVHGSLVFGSWGSILNSSHVESSTIFKASRGSLGQPIPVVLPASVITSAQQQQPFAIQNHIPVLQPGFSVPPISVPGPNSFHGNKFS
ncbi:nuclear pore complex protein [Trifolium repens]|nr:nuclear pore complex protein [Trifolium repens]